MNKIVKIPPKETYYFCKRILFDKLGDNCISYADILDHKGWIGYPYSEDKEGSVVLVYFCKTEESFKDVYETVPNFKHIKIIITDIEISEDIQDEIIDISNLNDYYKTELSLPKFIDNLLK